MNKFKSISKFALYLITLLFLMELLVRFFFPYFQENMIFYDVDHNLKKDLKFNEIHRISKGINTYYKIIDDIQFRVINKSENLDFENEYQSVWFFGDSVTNGYGVEYQNNFPILFNDMLKSEGKKVNIFNNAQYGATVNFKNKLLNDATISKFKSNDIIIYQFNFNDITEIAKTKNKKSNPNEASFLINLTNNSQVFRYKYLNHSALIKFLSNYAKKIVRKTSGDCNKRGLFALGEYTHAYSALGFEKESEESWNSFENTLLEIKNQLKEKNINFYVLISPISLQVLNHSYIDKINLDLNCSTINARKKILNFLEENNFNIIDPLDNFNSSSEMSKKENNFIPLFHLGDTNHPTKKGHYLIALELFKKVKNTIVNK